MSRRVEQPHPQGCMITIQYLEPAPEIASIPTDQVVSKLQQAWERLPFTHLLIGWAIPERLLEACKKFTEQHTIQFLRWHPLLTYNQAPIDPALQVINLYLQPIPGFQNLPEFTFFCPNHPAAQERILADLSAHIETGLYDGFFLDRIRYPSPSSDPYRSLGCFCPSCRKIASDFDLDLEKIRAELLQAEQKGQFPPHFLASFGVAQAALSAADSLTEFQRFLHFRAQSITNILQEVTVAIKTKNLEVGLDAFSPSLAFMVGQDLAKITPLADWTKVMSYAHTLGPAGIPYELSQLAQFLKQKFAREEIEILSVLSQIFELEIPHPLEELLQTGLSSSTLAKEIERAVQSSPKPILAGIELVEIPGVATLSTAQIEQDLQAVKQVKPAGIAISWDLWHIPLERLEIVRRAWS